MMTKKTFSELKKLKTFEDRFIFLQLSGNVGEKTFGYDRPMNQLFYKSREWARVRDSVIVRDQGLDLGCFGFEIIGKVIIHHMNPVALGDLENFNPDVLDPEYLITTSVITHRAIHYGAKFLAPRLPPERRPGDTTLW